MHISSQNHKKMQSVFNERPDKYKSSFTFSFEKEFSDIFRYKYGYNKFVPINRVYNDLISNKHHTHISATKWSSVTGFAHCLQRSCLKDGAEEAEIEYIESPMGEEMSEEKVKKLKKGLVPNKFGLIWKVAKGSRSFKKENSDDLGSIDEIKVMLIDYQSIVDKERRERDQLKYGREAEKKREQKHLDKQIQLAQEALEKAKANEPAPSEGATSLVQASKLEMNIEVGKATTKEEAQVEVNAPQAAKKSVFGAIKSRDAKEQLLNSLQKHQ
mmetsp:Transcript_17819/g.30213  ORF Transcript_17819/g.30213 Transcript_17819/m.30213 type:complete len:271 (+) Transcript_17819:83-895(+)